MSLQAVLEGGELLGELFEIVLGKRAGSINIGDVGRLESEEVLVAADLDGQVGEKLILNLDERVSIGFLGDGSLQNGEVLDGREAGGETQNIEDGLSSSVLSNSIELIVLHEGLIKGILL